MERGGLSKVRELFGFTWDSGVFLYLVLASMWQQGQREREQKQLV